MSHKMYINGQWVDSSSRKTFKDFNPATGEVVAEVPSCTVDDVKRAIDAAHAAQPAWAALLPAERAGYLMKAIEAFGGMQDELLKLLIEETGSGFGKSMFELSLVPAALSEAAGLVSREIGEVLPSNVPGKVNMTVRQPAGVISVISPWNFPLYLSLRGFVYALALGNTAVIKPSEDSPLIGGLKIAEAFEKAGLPKGVVNVVTCAREDVAAVGHEMIHNPKVARISFTGSTAVGKYIAAEASKSLKRAVLEMGGKNPIIVLKDADIDYAVNVAFFSAFLHQGQICMSADKIIVDRSIVDRFTEKLVAKVQMFQPMDPHSQMCVIGPIINQRQLDKIKTLVGDAVAQGAVARCGGAAQGPFFQPTVLTGVTPSMKIFYEEIFGPVTMIIPAKDEDEAVAIANDTDYGLSSGIVTGDVLKGLELAKKVKAGMVHINDSCVHDEPHCPFGGLKSSGWYGKWGATGAIEAFTDMKWVSYQTAPRVYPF